MDMKSHPKGTMGQMKFQTLINYYLDDMCLRDCTDDSILTNKQALERFSRFMSPDGNDDETRASLDHVNREVVDGFVNQLTAARSGGKRILTAIPNPVSYHHSPSAKKSGS